MAPDRCSDLYLYEVRNTVKNRAPRIPYILYRKLKVAIRHSANPIQKLTPLILNISMGLSLTQDGFSIIYF